MIIKMSEYVSSDNASSGMKHAVDAAESGDTILFDITADYHFYKDFSEHRLYHMTNTDSFDAPDKYFAILLENKEGITIDGNGSTFVIHGDMCAFALVKCKNITIKNFRISYNSPTNFEFTVKNRSRHKIVYSIPESSEFAVKNKNIVFYEKSPFSKENYYECKNNRKCYCNVIHRDNEVFRTQLSPTKTAVKIKRLNQSEIECTYIIPPSFNVGDTVALSRNWCRDNSGLFFWECSDITSNNITVNYMHGFGWLSQMCENLSFNKINFTPDFERGYKVSSFADCIHVCGCKGYVNINECLFEHPHDDGINIHGAFLRLKNIIDSHTAVFEFAHRQQGGYKNFFAGDRVKFYSRMDLSEFNGIYTVKSTLDDIDNKCVTITFNEQLPKMTNKMAVAENITYNPKVSITNCTFRYIPTRGILCTTREESDISGNIFKSLKMPDIFISCDCKDWYESGPCKNLKIHNNTFSQKNPVKFEPICIGKPVDNVHENVDIFDNKEEY